MRPKNEFKIPHIAFIEQALVSGLQMVPIPKRNPFNTTSKGIGEVIIDSYTKGAREIYLGVGGSATVDFGIGAIHALGVPIYDQNNNKFPPSAILRGGDIRNIKDIDYRIKVLPGLKLKMLTDVDNPLLGPNGAVYVYAKQKGATDEDLPVLESYMAKLSQMAYKKSDGRIRLDDVPKMGAAGAIGAGLSGFVPCEFYNGIKLVAELSGLEEVIRDSDVVITGEGAFDTQTLEGKTVSYVIKTGQKYGKRIIVICGIDKVPKETTKNLGIEVYDLGSRFSKEACFKKTEECINTIISKEIKPTLI